MVSVKLAGAVAAEAGTVAACPFVLLVELVLFVLFGDHCGPTPCSSVNPPGFSVTLGGFSVDLPMNASLGAEGGATLNPPRFSVTLGGFSVQWDGTGAHAGYITG